MSVERTPGGSSTEPSEGTSVRWSKSFRDQVYRRMSMVTVIVHTMVIPVSLLLFILICLIPLFWPLLGVYALVIFLDSRPERGAPLNWLQRWWRRSWWWEAFVYYYPITLHKTVDLEPSDPPIVGNTMLATISPFSWPDFPLFIVVWPLVIMIKAFWRVIGWRFIGWKVLGTNQPTLPPQPLTEADSPKRPSKKYLFGVSPHGIISMGAFGAMATEGANWSQLFPGVSVRLLTLANNFYYPFYRQFLLAVGVASVSKQSCINLLNNNQNIAIVLGGARESLLAEPGEFNLILNKRKGFVKVALQTGASLVPVLSFGENDIYEQVRFEEGSWGHKILLWMTEYLGFTVPLFHARGIFDYDKGVIAYRRPINVVVGRPIDVPLTENPSQEVIDHYHRLYIEQLKELFDANVEKFTPGVELRIVD